MSSPPKISVVFNSPFLHFGIWYWFSLWIVRIQFEVVPYYSACALVRLNRNIATTLQLDASLCRTRSSGANAKGWVHVQLVLNEIVGEHAFAQDLIAALKRFRSVA